MIIGENIREWRIADDAIGIGEAKSISSNSVEIYRYTSNKGDVGVLDMLKIEIPEKNRTGTLESIIIRDTAPDIPCLFVVGITVKAP